MGLHGQFEVDARNQDIQVFVKNKIVHRRDAKVSVFDSSVQGGDAVWEGLRLYNGRIFCLDRHLNRLQNSAHAMAFEDIPSKEYITNALKMTLQANKMHDGVHIRLTLTRGEKITSSMNPQMNQFGSCLIVLAEWKLPVYPSDGVELITSSIRRNPPSCIDSKIHHNNLINNILAKIEANLAGVHDAVMLDLYGFVSETNATNIFMVKNDKVLTPHADACLPGITRGVVIEICGELGIPIVEKNLSMTEFYTADEVFTTGTMGELSPVMKIDGREIRNYLKRPVTQLIQKRFMEWVSECKTDIL
ncbi:MAG: aminotransferase class IV [Chitinophagales bacterium]